MPNYFEFSVFTECYSVCRFRHKFTFSSQPQISECEIDNPHYAFLHDEVKSVDHRLLFRS